MSQVYLIGGLGADERVFSRLMASFPDAVFLSWLVPEPEESIADYSRRLSSRITAEHPVIIGVSFGGMLAVEIGKILPAARLILISSAKTKFEIPGYFRALGSIGLHRIFPYFLLQHARFFNRWLFGVRADNGDLLDKMIRGTDPAFLRWAVRQILFWENRQVPENYLHIHGDKDRILPIRFTNFAHKVEGAGHFMIVDRAPELIGIIQQHLSQIQR